MNGSGAAADEACPGTCSSRWPAASWRLHRRSRSLPGRTWSSYGTDERGLRSDRSAQPHERPRQRAGDDAQADDPGRLPRQSVDRRSRSACSTAASRPTARSQSSLVNADRAKDLPHRPVLVQGAAWGGGVNIVNNGYTDLTESPAKLDRSAALRRGGARADGHRVRRALRLLHLQRAVADRGLRIRRARRGARHARGRGVRPRRPGSCRSTPMAGSSPRATSTG